MSLFTLKTLATEERVGEKLRRAREDKKATLKDAAEILHIRVEYLAALENEEYDRLPSGLYGRQFLKEYSQLLKLDYRKLVRLTPYSEEKTGDNPFSQKILRRHKFLVFPKIIRNALLIGLFCIFLLYLLIYFRRLTLAPDLSLEYPSENLITNALLIEVKGKSDPETEISINNTSIMSTEDGSFTHEIRLKRGLNNITISAKKKYGRESLIQRQILVEESYEQTN
ncbi:MAG: helix-turn-helix domain-containing protein [bacterium]|nr:helix-turn-helix domain-containing protein [bacterium]